MSKLIHETPDYALQVGLSHEVEGRSCYQIVNRVTDVIEAETFVLPQAYDYIEQIQAGLDVKREAIVEMEKAAKPAVATAVFPH